MARGVPKHPKAFRGFVHVDAEHASSRTMPQPPRDRSDVPLDHLILTVAQRDEIDRLYSDGNSTFTSSYDSASEQDQLAAAALLAAHRLDIDARECASNKWNVAWSITSGGKEVEQTYRVLYQWCVVACSVVFLMS